MIFYTIMSLRCPNTSSNDFSISTIFHFQIFFSTILHFHLKFCTLIQKFPIIIQQNSIIQLNNIIQMNHFYFINNYDKTTIVKRTLFRLTPNIEFRLTPNIETTLNG